MSERASGNGGRHKASSPDGSAAHRTRPPIRLAFVDFWDGFDPERNFIVDALRDVAAVKIDERRPDLVLRSTFGERHRAFDRPKVLVKVEADGPERFKERYVIGHDFATSLHRLRYPLWAWDQHVDLTVPSSVRHPTGGERFCNFLYSNHRAHFRNAFFETLNSRRAVDALGDVFGHLESERFDAELAGRLDVDWRASKYEVLARYMFTIAFENVSQPGYSTEKIADAFLAGSIPVYWGDPYVAKDFNPESFVNLHDFTTPFEAVEHILALSDDPVRIDALRRQPPMLPHVFARFSQERLRAFLFDVLQDAEGYVSRSAQSHLGPLSRLRRRLRS